MKLGTHMLSVSFGLLMIVMVISGAVAFAFTDFMIDRLSGPRRQAFVFILIAYAIYRIFRLYQALKQPPNEKQ